MKPTTFPQQNTEIAKTQDEYQTLPAFVDSVSGMVVSCWRLTLWERIKLLFTGRIWWHVWTFNQPLQPQLPAVDDPFKAAEKDAKRKVKDD